MAIFTIEPMLGNYRSFFLLETDELTPVVSVFDQKELQSFLYGQVINNGIWNSPTQGHSAFLVRIEAFGQPTRCNWMVVDNPMYVTTLSFLPVEDFVDRPWPDAVWCPCANRAKATVDKYLEENADGLEDLGPDEYVESLLSAICEQAPWADHVYVRMVAVIGPEDDPEAMAEEGGETPEVLLARELTFMDGSLLFLTPNGAFYAYQAEMIPTVQPGAEEFGYPVVTQQLH